MADTVREIERKYEATDGAALPGLTGVAGVAAAVGQGVTTLDATYYDTPAHRLAADGVTLRRRTGGGDAGWHLKLPVGPDTRDEIRAPLSDTPPPELLALVRSRTRGTGLVPVVRMLSERDVTHLVDADGALIAEVSTDQVTASRLPEDGEPGAGEPVLWSEIEVELAPGRDAALLDAIEERLTGAGLRRAGSASKLAHALAATAVPKAPGKETGTPGTQQASGSETTEPGTKRAPQGQRRAEPDTAGDVVLAYARHQIAAIVALDPAVRLDAPDSVHQMRVATRRLRSAFRSYRTVLDRAVTDPIGEELKWLAGELGVDRDREVLTARLAERLAELPGPLRVGPVPERIESWSRTRRSGSRQQIATVLDGDRYRALLDTLDALAADPPLLAAASRKPRKVIRKTVLREYERLAGRIATALDAPPGPDRDPAFHDARKAAKRARYAAEVARPVLGKPAKRFARHGKDLQDLLGDHQDSVVAREALTDLAAQAQSAGESAFTYGVMYGREESRAAADERELPGAWEAASAPKLRKALRG
ncbi:CYTH and CHAD domain-containing protein [Streptomyces sp. XD-27]|uniref:CYTH and CHAD domain-containing protein n=1 Tax=Streptomyces sp. XD-27 TaxID=3062779 RepID=UPI0026F44E82|nr:CYTH and CHAD domain-containing protein [Streptomyces sp. XD-27]WKX70309.1 CYTH and CHAD domain-containing protein [Streptomyces sp. XD-27]